MPYIAMTDWLTAHKMWGNLVKQSGEKMSINLSLLTRPRRVKQGTKTIYVYAPPVVSANPVIPPGTCIKILEVLPNEGEWSDTLLKVLTYEKWEEHDAYWKASQDEPTCSRYRRDEVDPMCACELPFEDMPEYIKQHVHYVLITDIGK